MLENSKQLLKTRIHCPDTTGESEIIDDVSQDKRFFLIEGWPPLILADAIVYCNLVQFVKGKKWFEVLEKLNLSQRGRHFIYTAQNEGTFPTLIASARLLTFDEKAHWLTFSPFFNMRTGS